MKAHPLLVPAIAASQFAPPFMISGVAVALPALGADLGAGATARSLGMVSGMLIVAALVSLNLGHAPVDADPARFVATMQVSFWILAVLTGAALAISLRKR